MPLLSWIKSVLVIGSGAVVIGQAAEFDYAGSQACLSLREEGIRTVLLNNNPATIQTDRNIADRIYIEPITPEVVERIIAEEKIDAILATMGGQTALNLAIALERGGILKKYGIKIIGTDVPSIQVAEDRERFHELMEKINEPVAPSLRLSADTYSRLNREINFFPIIVRTSFSLGGLGGTIVRNLDELNSLCDEYFRIYPDQTLEIEKSLEGLKELEYEVIRDNAGNCIIVCNMENLDPMGVHTGESIVVTPSQTLSDIEYHMLRDSAIHVISSIGILGACNIQFALDSESGKYYVVEVNPRTSRSSALASKASGYPIARISAKIAVGYNLNEIINPITGNTYAAFEPSLDYVTVKIPRWPFDKLPVSRKIGVQMKSIGEVMGIGRTFEEALMKAISSLENQDSRRIRMPVDDSTLEDLIREPSDQRLFAIFEALLRGWAPEKVAQMCGYPRYFIIKIKNITDLLTEITYGEMPGNLHELKSSGISDLAISAFSGLSEESLTGRRFELGILPVYKSIDTCSGEFPARTPYLYSTYEVEDEFTGRDERESVLIIGSGPNRIAQGLEFDYSAVKAVMDLRKRGFRAIMVNSNPETVSTDFDISDLLFFEPLTVEYISNIIRREWPCRVIVQFSGQTGQNLISKLSSIFGPSIFLGTSPDSVERIESRDMFSEALHRMGILQPEFRIVKSIAESELISEEGFLPAIARSSFVIGGRAMDIVYTADDLVSNISEIITARPGSSVLVSRYIADATEIDVDFISSRNNVSICGICRHIEEAGTHSGDATMLLSPDFPDVSMFDRILEICRKMSEEFNLIGFSNLQIAIKDGQIYVIELNARSSRSLPFVCKATGRDWISLGISLMLGQSIHSPHGSVKKVFAKVPSFPFNRFLDLDTVLGPEMKSTGESMFCGSTAEEALVKSTLSLRRNQAGRNSTLISVRDSDKPYALELAELLHRSGFRIFATPGTYSYLKENGIQALEVYKIEDMRSPRVDEIIRGGEVGIVINTPESRRGSLRDGNEIRRLSIRSNCLLATNMRLAEAIVSSMVSKPVLNYMEIGDYV